MIQNNITRMLQAKEIPFAAFELPTEKLGAREAAQHLGVAPQQVYKTIVVTRQERGKNLLVVVPGDQSVNLKKVAKSIGVKKVVLPTEKQAETLTGLQAGGISPLALINRGFEVLIDESARKMQAIFISGGQRGLNIRLAPDDLVELTGASYAEVV